MKRILSIILAFVFVVGVFATVPLTPIANAASVDDLTFEINEEGTMYQVKDCNKSASGDLVIPETYNGLPVTKIEAHAFSRRTSLTSITIPDSISVIGMNAFVDSSINAVYITDIANWCNINFMNGGYTHGTANNPLEVAQNLYLNGDLLVNLTIPETVTNICNDVFCGCNSLVTLKIPGSVKKIGAVSFHNCKSLKEATLYKGVEYIGVAAFENCDSLENIIISDTVINIAERAFYGCPALKSVTIPDSVKNIDRWAFGYKYDTWQEQKTKIPGFTIYGTQGSAAEEYATENDFTFIGMEETKPHEHNYTSTITKQPTYTETGIKTFNCSCGDSYTEVIPKLNLSLETPVVTIKNTAKGIEVNWKAIEGAENYILYKKTYDATNKKWSGWKTVRSGYADTSYTDTTVILGTQYRYTVRAVNGTVMSEYKSTSTLKYNVTPTVKISNVATGVKVTWSTAANATGYVVYRSQYSNGKWSGWKNMGTAKANKTAWTDKNVKSGVQYKYTVRACYNKIKSSYKDSNVTIFLTQPTVKFANALTGIKVSWSKVSGVTGYTVYRSQYTNGKWSGWKNMGTAKSTKSSWTDKKVESGATYKYTVRAVNGNYKSTYTDTKGLLYLAQPTVTAKAVSNGINVAWSQCEGATGYTVYRSEYNTKTKKWSSWKSMGTAKATKSNWTDTKTTKGVQYKYTVRAVNADTGAKSSYVASKEVKR